MPRITQNNSSINLNSDESIALRLQIEEILEVLGLSSSKIIATLPPTCRGAHPFQNNSDNPDRDGASPAPVLVR